MAHTSKAAAVSSNINTELLVIRPLRAGNPLDDAKLLVQTVGSLLRGNALRQGAKSVSFGSREAAAAGKA